MLYCLEGREKILDLFEAATGSRMTCNYMRPGGVREDLPEGWLKKCKALVDLPRYMDELEELMTENEILLMRCRGWVC